MLQPNIPFEGPKGLPSRWIETAVLPFRSPLKLWDQLCTSNSLAAPTLFAYSWVLLSIPFIFMTGKIALSNLYKEGGPYIGMPLAITLPIALAVLLDFLIRPIVLIFIGGSIVHAVACRLDDTVFGNYKLSIRCVGYAVSWIMPLFIISTLLSISSLLDPGSSINKTNHNNLKIDAFNILVIAKWLIPIFSVIWIGIGVAMTHKINIIKALISSLVGIIGSAIFSTLILGMFSLIIMALLSVSR